MTQSVAHDFLLVLTITGLGMGIGLSFDCYRLLRRKFRPNYLSTQLSDLLFWLICVGPTFYAFYWIIEGSVRFFTILFLPVGMFLYLKFASPYIREPLYYCFLQIGLTARPISIPATRDKKELG
jgi:spore cortex biosynthesis protein YabQ